MPCFPREGNQWRVRLHAAQTESITGTSTSTPTTVASARRIPAEEGDRGGHGQLEEVGGPINAPGAARMLDLEQFMRP